VHWIELQVETWFRTHGRGSETQIETSTTEFSPNIWYLGVDSFVPARWAVTLVYPPFYRVSELEKEGKERRKKGKEEDWGGTSRRLYNK